ncbi:hypothetical protein MB02_10210 [Croceicoccus estronivorus]|uniref:TonB-dependent receptor n=1 Tax=Croceicoccus estronivorus TaxID=1172626 RepID=UPI00083168A7|nr:TonB-dependent receptor [Croceicoccus estronivorus]OCC23544.1 hypothetical protein MB02_10210 [Croceicoccus estronivorus]
MKTHRRVLLLAASILPFMSATPVIAQETTDTAVRDGAAIQDIVVTARRREESLQDVPVAITALGSDEIRQRNIQTASDLQRIVPSLTIATAINRTSESFSLRGLGSSQGASVASTVVNSVQTYFNEVPGQSGVGSYYDMQNVQVLKGPQGTLFGRNTTGGAVLFETRRPTYELDGYLQIQGGSHDLYGIEGALNIPIVPDVLAVRVAGTAYHRDGFTKNYAQAIDTATNTFTSLGTQKLDDRKYWSGRISVLFEPVPEFRNTTIYNYFETNRNGDGAVLRAFNRDAVFAADLRGVLPQSAIDAFGLNNPLPLTLAGGPSTAGLSSDFTNTILAAKAAGRFSFFSDATLEAVLAQQQACGIRCTFTGFLQNYHARTQIFANLTDWDVSDGITLRNIFGYNRQDTRYAFDYDGTPLTFLGVANTKADGRVLSQENISNEFQIQGRTSGLNYVLGAFAEWNSPAGFSQTRSATIGGVNLVRPRARGHTYALFAQATVNLDSFVEGLKFTAGGRYTWDKRSGTAQQFNAVSGLCSQGGAPGNGTPFDDATCRVDRSAKFKQPTWTLSFDYQASDNVLIYLASRRGYKPGGFNFAVPSAEYLTYGPEKVTDLEFGTKADWYLGGDAELRTNISLYRSWYNDIIQSFGTAINGQALTVLINGGSADIKGAELEATLVPTPGLSISGFYSYTDAKLKDSSTVFGYVPKHKFNISMRYELPVAESLGKIIPSLSYSHQSGMWGSPLPLEPYNRLPGFGTLDLRLDWNGIAGSSFDASIFATNVTNKNYVQGRLTTFSSLGLVADTWGEPRMIGAQLRYRFGTSANR